MRDAVTLGGDCPDNWREPFARLPERPGASARLEHVIAGGPEGDVRLGIVVTDGRLTDAKVGGDPEAPLTITTTYADAQLLAAGELEASVAVMQGRAKVAGDVGSLLAVLPVTHTPEFRAALASARSGTA